MERGDIASIGAAIAIVVIVAALISMAPGRAEEPSGPSVPAGISTPPSPTTPVLERETEAIGPYRIRYEKNYQKYPLYHLPGNLSVYGASDPAWRTGNEIVFAYIEESAGGVTETFRVPYPVWRINCTTFAERLPEYAWFRMALVDAEKGAIVTAAELRYPGNVFKNVQIQGREYYLIISCSHIDRYTVTLETLPAYLQ
ncbi:MAG: hypothetical protein KO206_09375 [Methanomicrobiaceae archaeon]|uniref:Uncharacterized protein n=1 Tax=hydrocarbon metagenome TaxID=938273 RepID=A0A0W8FI19_9ZZZZ|nr:hypothetical protein [Methanomicrobiaceae archaeon]MDD5418933.1 hypothetical protein [Methanomicrobiaceae archaeon]